ncbi:preprotein translocase subunit SecE [Candidatus Peribacteria bacterium RIFCSPLOWO2_01_FULL_51_18]|nr:MAG: preprotein translocase subunit SecE [Candidatus Peribacteria bacterium RIFCSPLOWO2_01_FULL_51_18]OGJ68012.1 MAG: preprotein translocase subunit SecE [Candidatus Peribacteria bacterium RIFCSPLOWO2_02_FULL_51_10]
MKALLSYFRESLTELRLVRWPTQQQAIRLTIIVMIFIAVNSIFFGITDAVFTQIIRTTLRI